MKLYAQGAMQDYATGIGLMIQSVLIAPSFVYRTELGPATLTADASGKFPDTTLTPYEVASQLGFLLLGSIPDDQADRGGRQRQPRDDERPRRADRSPARERHGQGEPDERDDRLVQRPADVLEDEGHQPVLGARDRGPGPGDAGERSSHARRRSS